MARTRTSGGSRPASRRSAAAAAAVPGGQGHVGVRDLAAGMNAGVGAAGHREGRPGSWPSSVPSASSTSLLHGALAGLAGPAVEPGAVVGQVKPEPDHGSPAARRGRVAGCWIRLSWIG